MSFRTQFFRQLPWTGGYHATSNVSAIPPNQLKNAFDFYYDEIGFKKKREGIDFFWTGSSGTPGDAVVALHHFVYGITSKTKKTVRLSSAGGLTSHDPETGTSTPITVNGTPWSGLITSATMVTFNNKLFIAVNGSSNRMKMWDGTNAAGDVYNSYDITSISRASAGTTRTIIFDKAFPGIVGSTVVIYGAGNSNYNGTFTVATKTTTTVADDTITYTAAATLNEGTTADIAIAAGIQAPFLNYLSIFRGRLVGSDKTNIDRMHYCETFNHTKWNGDGDSGARDIGIGDGDTNGITGFSPMFKGDLYVGKTYKMYRISGGAGPEDWVVTKVSDTIGLMGNHAIKNIDQDDLVWISRKGIHSLKTTATYGDTETAYISYDIQSLFRNFNAVGSGQGMWIDYFPDINSIVLIFNTTGIYFYNFQNKAWFIWRMPTDRTANCLSVIEDTLRTRLYIGTNNSKGEIGQGFSGDVTDTLPGGAGTPSTVTMQLTTGHIIPDGNPATLKAFKRLYVYYKATAAHTLTATFDIDNQTSASENTFSITDAYSTSSVNTTFVAVRTVTGIGRGFTLDLSCADTAANTVEIQGFEVEYELLPQSFEMAVP